MGVGLGLAGRWWRTAAHEACHLVLRRLVRRLAVELRSRLGEPRLQLLHLVGVRVRIRVRVRVRVWS